MKNVKNKTARSLENVHTGDCLTNRLVYLDLLNVLAIVAVIAMHCNGLVHGNPMTRAWNTKSCCRMHMLFCCTNIFYDIRCKFNEI